MGPVSLSRDRSLTVALRELPIVQLVQGQSLSVAFSRRDAGLERVRSGDEV
jgi:hypothetical protein